MGTHHQPVHALIHAAAIHRRARHDAPVAVAKLTEAQRFGNFARALSTRLVLLVGKDEQGSVLELLLVEHGSQLVGSRLEAVNVSRIDDEDDGGRIGVVAAPVRADGSLTTEILAN